MHDLKTIRRVNAPVSLRNAHLAAVNLYRKPTAPVALEKVDGSRKDVRAPDGGAQ